MPPQRPAQKSRRHTPSTSDAPRLEKVPTGIDGFDTITGGGLPKGRPTLVCGGPGCGKTLFGLQFLISGIARGEHGVLISFEESTVDLATNVAALHVDLLALERQKKVAIDYIQVDRSEILETGGYDLSALFVRIEHAVQSVGATRVFIDTLEALYAGFTNAGLMRAELERLFRWLKDRGLTTVVTGEKGEGVLTRHGLEEYVSDCVILLDQRVNDQLATRRLRVVKYRGSSHGSNEYPFLIDEKGISVLPITGIGLDYPVSKERVSSGLSDLDAMLGGKGYYRGSSVLLSGTAGTGKTSVACAFAHAFGSRGERCLYFALEEPAQQIARNMLSIGMDLSPLLEKGTLRIVSARPTLSGLEQHLVTMHALIERFQPQAVIVDPISSLVDGGNPREVKAMLVRLFDYLKMKGITGLFIYLSAARGLEETDMGISSLIDTWLELRNIEARGERNRALYILKSRGMAHSHQVREFLIGSGGLELIDAFIGPDGVLTGSARRTSEDIARVDAASREQDALRRHRTLERRRKLVEGQIDALRAELAAEEEENRTHVVARQLTEEGIAEQQITRRQSSMGNRPATAIAKSGRAVKPREQKS